jgi:hypothetical protein
MCLLEPVIQSRELNQAWNTVTKVDILDMEQSSSGRGRRD